MGKVLESRETVTGYELELALLDRDICDFEARRSIDAWDRDAATRYAYRLYQRASLTGRFDALAMAETALQEAMQRYGPWEDLCLLKARLAFTLHRPAEARRDLALVSHLAQSYEGRTLAAEIDLQEGRYARARQSYASLIAERKTWDNLARLAYLLGKMGDPDGAEQLYLAAEAELTAKQLRSYAWIELQMGLLHFTHGAYERAWAHYRQADRAYPGYWLVQEHIAECLGAQGSYAEAADLYRAVLASVPRPELAQALGDLYSAMGDRAEAKRWHAKALADYLASANRGEVHYLHHLVDFYVDVAHDGAEAVRWARQDLELRPNYLTWAALAWALLQAGQTAEALGAIRQALASPMQDAEVYAQAATIHRAAGLRAEGERLAQAAADLNPHHQDFHIHH